MLNIVRRLTSLLTTRQKVSMVLCTLFFVGVKAVAPASNVLLKETIDSVCTDSFFTTIAIYIGFAIAVNVGNYISCIYRKMVNVDHLNTISQIAYEKVIRLDHGKFYGRSSAELINDLNNSTLQVGKFLAIFMDMAAAGMTLVSSAVVLWVLDTKVSIAFIAFAPVIVFVVKRNWNKCIPMEEANRNVGAKYVGAVTNAVKGFALIKAFGTESFESDRMKDIRAEKKEAVKNLVKANVTLNTSVNVLDEIIIIAVLCYGALSGMSASTMFAIILATSTVFNPIFQIIGTIEELQGAYVAATKILDILDIENDINDGKINLSKFNREIEINNVVFSYNKSDDVINGVSAKIKKGQRIGICGPSGSGKSTILSLLNRMYDVDSGSIMIDGINIKDLTLKSLRKHIGIVQQDPYLFEGSIMDNIKYGCPNTTEYDVVEAAKKANVHEFVSKLPEGYNTQVGDNGMKLSGGQKQRIAIARVFLADPDIILFDEATAALDNCSEQIIKDSVDKLSSEKTTITVAHRLTTIENCDTILVMDNHKIVEQGTYEELIELGGVFSKLATKPEPSVEAA